MRNRKGWPGLLATGAPVIGFGLFVCPANASAAPAAAKMNHSNAAYFPYPFTAILNGVDGEFVGGNTDLQTVQNWTGSNKQVTITTELFESPPSGVVP